MYIWVYFFLLVLRTLALDDQNLRRKHAGVKMIPPGGMMVLYSNGGVVATSSFIGTPPSWIPSLEGEEEDYDDDDFIEQDEKHSLVKKPTQKPTTTKKTQRPLKQTSDYEYYEDEFPSIRFHRVIFPFSDMGIAKNKKPSTDGTKATPHPNVNQKQNLTTKTTKNEEEANENSSESEEVPKVFRKPQRPYNTFFPIIFNGYQANNGKKSVRRPFTSVSNSFSSGNRGFAISSTDVRPKVNIPDEEDDEEKQKPDLNNEEEVTTDEKE